MKKGILTICYYINILLVIGVALLIIAMIFKINAILDFASSESVLQIRMMLTLPVLILWINNLIVWSKNDKKVMYFLLIFFFNALYNPFYYNRIKKNNWQ